MNARFRTSISGFNRQDVLDYIKKLLEEKALLEKEKIKSAEQLEQAESCISDLKEQLAQQAEKLAELETLLDEKVRIISRHDNEILLLQRTISAEYEGKLSAVKQSCSDAEAELVLIETELQQLAQRVVSALSPVNDALTTTENIPVGENTDENL